MSVSCVFMYVSVFTSTKEFMFECVRHRTGELKQIFMDFFVVLGLSQRKQWFYNFLIE